MKERLKKYNIPILVLALLILIGGFGYIVYDYSNLFVNDQNAVVENTETKPEEKQQEPIADPEPDHTLINGYWKTEILEDGRFLEFTINYPEVTNFDGTKGTAEYDAESKGYIVTIKHETGVDTVFLISDFDDNTGTVYYYENGSEELNTLAMNRDPETAPDNVLANTAEQKPETNQNTTSNTASNNKPSSSGNSTKPSSSTGNSGNSNNNSDKKGHYEERQVCVQEAWDEQVLVKKGECTSVLVKDAWDEQVADYSNAYFNGDPVDVVVCNQCGAVVYGNFFEVHGNEEHRGWHNEIRDTCEPYWHNVTYTTVHHDAVYEAQCEPDEYTTVHHDAVYETQMVWVED